MRLPCASIHACNSLGVESVVAVSAADRDSLAARIATRAICIGPPPAPQSYLRPELLITAAKGTECQAIHPGYGFLSERAPFSRMCSEEGIVFIGPSPDAIEAMGDKLSAVQLAEQAGVPRVPGSGRIKSAADVQEFVRRHGLPVLIKASAGGGGRGMRIVRREADMDREIQAAAAEAQAAFGDPSVYVEKFIERARHIEIQVLGRQPRQCRASGRAGLLDPAPAPEADRGGAFTQSWMPAFASELAGAAVRLAKRVDYVGAGTVEFVFDEDARRWYFLEMNTRIQVEHPVTEMITGRDLVAEQIRIAAGQPISFTQDEVQLTGHAIECRINAEDATPELRSEARPPDGVVRACPARASASIRTAIPDTWCRHTTTCCWPR